MYLLSLLKRYVPIDQCDSEQAERIKKFIETDPACFNRSNLKGHITGSAWLVDPSGTKVLLTHHKKLGKWLQLGGHADGEADVLSVALREAQEESGLEGISSLSDDIFDVDIHPIPARDPEPAHEHFDVRFLFQSSGLHFTVSNESNELAWVEIEKISELSTEESLLRMARKWKQKKNS